MPIYIPVSELKKLKDVDLAGLSDGDALVWDEAAEEFVTAALNFEAAGAADEALFAATTYADNKLAKASNLSDVASPATARANLGVLLAPHKRAGSIRETVGGRLGTTGTQVLTSGRARASAIYLYAGETVTTLSIMSGAVGATNPTNQWMFLADGSFNNLRVSNDKTTEGWGTFTEKTFTLDTPYVVPTSGVYYVGIVTVAVTPPTVASQPVLAEAGALSPRIAWQGDTGLTTPASAPSVWTVANTGIVPYISVA